MNRFAALTFCCLVLVACSGPEGEEPVDLQPGRYDIQISGGPMSGASESKSLCFLPDRAKNFADKPLQGILVESTSSCTGDKKREGNAFSGSYSCSFGSGAEFDSMALKVAYDGSLTTDAFSMRGDIEVTGVQGGGRSGFTVTGKRSGDC